MYQWGWWWLTNGMGHPTPRQAQICVYFIFPLRIIGWWLVLPDRSWMLRWVAIASAYPLVISLMACWKTSPFVDGFSYQTLHWWRFNPYFPRIFRANSTSSQVQTSFLSGIGGICVAFVGHPVELSSKVGRPGDCKARDCCKLMVFFIVYRKPQMDQKNMGKPGNIIRITSWKHVSIFSGMAICVAIVLCFGKLRR